MIAPEEIMKHLKNYLENIDAMGTCKSRLFPFLNTKGNNDPPPFEEKQINFILVIQMEILVTNQVNK